MESISNQNINVFVISTPSQMMNAIEFIYHYDIQNECNKIYVTCISERFIDQIKRIGIKYNLDFIILFAPNFKFLKTEWFNRMPLKLVRLWVCKRRIRKDIKTFNVERLVLGNYANFISQFTTQIIDCPKFIVDDGNGTILTAGKRKVELEEGSPIFSSNRKKKALWLVKLLMGFYNYKISEKFTFFSSYTFEVYQNDVLVQNQFKSLKAHFSSQKIKDDLIYFIGSYNSEAGYLSERNEIHMMRMIVDKNKNHDVIYIAHRKDSASKMKKISDVMEVKLFDLPIEYALTELNEIPKQFIGFFTSALPNLADLFSNKHQIIALRIPNNLYKSNKLKDRANTIYDNFEGNKKVTVQPVE